MKGPGATIGVLGGGQLGRMTILAGRAMGYRFGVYEPTEGGCAGRVADWQINAGYDNEEALREFARMVDVVTLEFENVSLKALDIITDHVEVHPGKAVLEICQNKAKEKEYLKSQGYGCADFRIIGCAEDLKKAVGDIGESVLKKTEFGYDGKGQLKIDPGGDMLQAWLDFSGDVGVLEKWVDFDCECSVVVARNESGEIKVFPVAENEHKNHILYRSIVPARISEQLKREAEEMGEALAEGLGIIGLLGVELFLTKDGKWLVNEMAPRPHNSGHYTMDACVTSQFEQHVRAVCGLPLGSTALKTNAVMVNLLGDLWKGGEPDWNRLLSRDRVKLHLYDKGEARVGRKMGHFTVVGDPLEQLVKEAEDVAQHLSKHLIAVENDRD